MRRTYRTLNDCEMQHNAEVGLFTRPSKFNKSLYMAAYLQYIGNIELNRIGIKQEYANRC